MFLFLSKLLPLFLYPLGLACLLMLVALVMWWTRPRLVPVPVVLALIVLLLGSNSWVANSLVRSLELQHVPKVHYQRQRRLWFWEVRQNQRLHHDPL
jgi:4-amino-4-deoxy-L-arabinose transferase-like glycosyltransferase